MVLEFGRDCTDFAHWRYEDLTDNSEDTLKQISGFGGFELPGDVLGRAYRVKEVTSNIRNMNQESISELTSAQQEYIRSKTRSFVESHNLGY